MPQDRKKSPGDQPPAEIIKTVVEHNCNVAFSSRDKIKKETRYHPNRTISFEATFERDSIGRPIASVRKSYNRYGNPTPLSNDRYTCSEDNNTQIRYSETEEYDSYDAAGLKTVMVTQRQRPVKSDSTSHTLRLVQNQVRSSAFLSRSSRSKEAR